MNITSTGIAVALAVVVALGFLFFGARIFTPFDGGQAAQSAGLAASSTTTSSISDSMQSISPENLPTELSAQDEVVGTGATAEAGDTVTVNYVGTFPDGTVFDASAKHGQAFSFPLGGGKVISGWDRGVVGMKVGGKRLLIVPPQDGYGSQDYGPIPGNSTLIFQIELLDVQKN